jgi:hypothetical protein
MLPEKQLPWATAVSTVAGKMGLKRRKKHVVTTRKFVEKQSSCVKERGLKPCYLAPGPKLETISLPCLYPEYK